MAIFGHILETDRKFGEFYGRQTTVRELLGKVIKREKWDCSVDELNLYFPRKNGQRLQVNDPEYFDLEQGELSDGLREIMSDANRIDLDTRIRSFSATCEYDFLLEAPPRIRRKYRRSVAEIRRYFIELGYAGVKDPESFDEVCWWEKLRSYVLLPKVHVAPEKKAL